MPSQSLLALKPAPTLQERAVVSTVAELVQYADSGPATPQYGTLYGEVFKEVTVRPQ